MSHLLKSSIMISACTRYEREAVYNMSRICVCVFQQNKSNSKTKLNPSHNGLLLIKSIVSPLLCEH